jgi:hypothetical protein
MKSGAMGHKALTRWRHKDYEFEAHLGYTARPALKKQTNKQTKKKKSVIPSTQEVEFGRIKFKANSGKKLARSYLNYTSRAW